MSIFLLASVVVNAQTGNTSLVVSKGVQHVANKKAFADEDAKRFHIQARSVEFPAIVVSKGIATSNVLPSEGNITSAGYPSWAISKGVARKNMEQIQRKSESEENQLDVIPTDSSKISEK